MTFKTISLFICGLLIASPATFADKATDANAQMKTTAIAAATEVISIHSLLDEMVDRDSIARYPKHNFRLKQASSYNRASKTPDQPKGWFNNKDHSGQVIRVDEKDGKKEWVLMDHRGPGAIVRTWMPWHNQLKSGSNLTMRIYLDGEEQPAIEGNMLGLFDGSGFVPFPFAHTSIRSAVNFFPIPYQKSCKITTNGEPFFFQFTYREYDEGTAIKTFTMDDFDAAKNIVKSIGESLLKPTIAETDKVVKDTGDLKDKQNLAVDLPSGGAAIRELKVKLDDYSNPEVTREVVLKVEFDGKETVWCPIGDFFGSGIGLNPVQGWYRTVSEDGAMICRWVMPYKQGGKVSLVNFGDQSVAAELEVKTSSWEWDENTMYFNAGWRGQFPVPTRPYSDWNYVTLKGRGVYVGDTLTIMNPVKRWWGEGDEKIWVDGEDFPSIFGTGTEDYYAYSWGGRSSDFYEHPFHAQPRCRDYNKLNRKTGNEKNTQGYSTETRSRALDTMPFGQSLKLDMEVWSWTDCEMGYGVGCYWYGFSETQSNREPEPKEVLNIPLLPASMLPLKK